jgi:hypothetical protein
VVGNEKAQYHFYASVRIHKYHIYWETWEGHTIESLSYILKIYKNSGTMVKQRTWDIVFDLIVLSFNCSRPKWRQTNPMVEDNMGSDQLILIWRRIFDWTHVYFEAWKHCSNTWSIAEFSFAQGRAKVKLGGACWQSLISIINRQHIPYIYLIMSPNTGIGV